MPHVKVRNVKPVSDRPIYPPSTQKTYQQALEDFGVTKLLSYLRNYADEDFNAALMNLEEEELESLAAILIDRLTNHLNGKVIASYLNAIRHGDSDVLYDPRNWEIAPPAINPPADLPKDFTPRYKIGDRVCWQVPSQNTDWGVVIGSFYGYAQHRCQWAVGYLICLNPDSPCAAWTTADTAWEEDLQEMPNPSSHTYPHKFSRLPNVPKSFHTPPGRYHTGSKRNPRPIREREQNLIDLYSHCRLSMTPRQFYGKWEVNYEMIGYICSRSIPTVKRWFATGQNYRRPNRVDLRHLALMDFLLEHFEEIPEKLRNILFFPERK